MDLYHYLKLSIRDKLIFCNQITPAQVEINPDVKLIFDIFSNLIESCNRFNIDLVRLLNSKEFKLPYTVQTLYEVVERSIIDNLPQSKWTESHHKLSTLRRQIRQETETEKQEKFDELKVL